MKKLLLRMTKKLELGSALAVRLTHWTGKADLPTHPKHLVDFGQLFYLSSLKSSDIVLDLGCHAGEHSLKAAKKVAQVVGVDINRQLIDQAKLLAKSENINNISFKVHDLEKKLPFKANSFTKAFFFAVLEHLNRRQQALKEIRRVLKKHGSLFISVPNKNSHWKNIQRSAGLSGFADSDHKLEFSKSEIVELLKKHGFTNIKVNTTAVDTPLSGLIDLVGGLSLTIYKQLMKWKISRGKTRPENSVGFLITATNG